MSRPGVLATAAAEVGAAAAKIAAPVPDVDAGVEGGPVGSAEVEGAVSDVSRASKPAAGAASAPVAAGSAAAEAAEVAGTAGMEAGGDS